MIVFALRTGKLFLGKIIPSLSLAIIYITFSHRLPLEEYGKYQQIWVVLSFSTIISCFGLPSVIVTLGNRLSGTDFQTFYKKALRYSMLALLVCYGFIFFYYQQIELINRLLLFPLIISQSYYLIQEALAISGFKEDKLTICNIIYAILLLAAHIIILYFSYSLSLLIISITILSITRSYILRFFLTAHSNFVSQITLPEIDIQRYYIGSNESIQILLKWLDKIVLAGIMSTADFALYFNGSIEIPFLNVLIASALAILSTEASKQTDNSESLIGMLKSSSLLMSSIVFPLFFFLILNRTALIELAFGKNYSASADIFWVVLLVLPLRIASFSGILQILKQGKKIIYGGIGELILMICLMIPLYHFFGPIGVAASVVISTYTQIFYYLCIITASQQLHWWQGLPFIRLFVRFAINGLILILLYNFIPDNIGLIKQGIMLVTMCILILINIHQQIPLKTLLLSILKK